MTHTDQRFFEKIIYDGEVNFDAAALSNADIAAMWKEFREAVEAGNTTKMALLLRVCPSLIENSDEVKKEKCTS